MKHLFFSALASFCISATYAQNSFPRLFLDLPSIYLATPDAEHIQNSAGAGLETAFNYASHLHTFRIGGGGLLTLDPQAEDLGKSLLVKPYGLFEIGLGKYRTNGDQCSNHHRNAFTAMAKGGLRYAYAPATDTEEAGFGLDYTVGAEFGYFYIRDIFKNQEFFLHGNYHIKAKTIFAGIGFKMFLNLRANRD